MYISVSGENGVLTSFRAECESRPIFQTTCFITWAYRPTWRAYSMPFDQVEGEKGIISKTTSSERFWSVMARSRSPSVSTPSPSILRSYKGHAGIGDTC